MADQSTRDMFQHVLNIIEGVDSSEAATHTALSVSAYFPQLTHYDQTIKTGNGFLYNHDGVNYLVTTAHLLFDTNKSVHSEQATVIKCNRQDLTKYCYSRFFDVAVFDVTGVDLGTVASIASTNKADTKPDNANVKYIDPHTGNNVLADAKYLNLANASVEMGAICHKLIQGASGAAVTNDIGKVLGMVSSCGEQYDNMSLCVPIKVIHKIVTSGTCVVGGQNYDGVAANNKFYPGVVTVPLQMGHLAYLPSTIEQGEVVVQTNGTSDVKPFDIITKVGSVVVGRENKVATEALVGSSTSMEVYRLKNTSWRDIYGALPRTVNISSGRITTPNVTGNALADRVTAVYSENSNEKVKGLNHHLYKLDDVSITGDVTLTNNKYKQVCLYATLKHWAFLVCSNITNLPMGHQHIVWANEVKKILPYASDEGSDDTISYEMLCVLVFYKLLEFNDISVMNLFNILLQNIANENDTDLTSMESLVNSLKKTMPILYNTNALSSSFNFFGKTLNVSGDITNVNVGTIALTDLDSIPMFEIISKSGSQLTVRPIIGLGSSGSFKIDASNFTYTTDADVLLTDNKDGNSSFTAEGFSSEHYDMKNTIAKASGRQLEQDNAARDLELTLQELEYLNAKTFADGELYYPRTFTLLKSFWDHCNITMGELMPTVSDQYEKVSGGVTITKSVLSAHLGTWNFDRLLQSGGGNGS